MNETEFRDGLRELTAQCQGIRAGKAFILQGVKSQSRQILRIINDRKVPELRLQLLFLRSHVSQLTGERAAILKKELKELYDGSINIDESLHINKRDS